MTAADALFRRDGLVIGSASAPYIACALTPTKAVVCNLGDDFAELGNGNVVHRCRNSEVAKEEVPEARAQAALKPQEGSETMLIS